MSGDVFTPEERSRVMAQVRSADTGPERAVRRLAHALGYRFRLQRKDLPGRPDLVFPGRRTALFVHGCFWHGHDCARGRRVPRSNADYWRAKIDRNRERDRRSLLELEALGWRVVIVWECELRDRDALARRLVGELGPRGAPSAR